MLNLGQVIGQCKDFCENGKRKEVTIVVAPLRIMSKYKGEVQEVFLGCSYHYHCQNELCQYSRRAPGGGY